MTVMSEDNVVPALWICRIHWSWAADRVRPLFNTLHQGFEVQYTELASAVGRKSPRAQHPDEPAPGSYARFPD